jgi:hypothetical protein
MTTPDKDIDTVLTIPEININNKDTVFNIIKTTKIKILQLNIIKKEVKREFIKLIDKLDIPIIELIDLSIDAFCLTKCRKSNKKMKFYIQLDFDTTDYEGISDSINSNYMGIFENYFSRLLQLYPKNSKYLLFIYTPIRQKYFEQNYQPILEKLSSKIQICNCEITETETEK